MATCCLLSIGTLDNFSAKADGAYPMTVKNYDGTEYAGVTIDKNNVDSFNEILDLSNSDLNTPLFQFVITPSQRGNGKIYTPDFEKLTFTLSDSKGKALSVAFSPRKADAPKWYYMCGFAAGQNQTLLGEHHNNYKFLEDPEEEYSALLTDVYASISPYTFDGYGADYSYFPFYDKDGNKAKAGQNGMIGIYYDREENAIYADMGYKWVDDDAEKPHTLTDKYKVAPNGEKRWRIRDLDSADYRKGGNPVSTTWEGFADLKNVSFKVGFSDMKNDDYSILLASLNGKSLTGNYYLPYQNKGVVNKTLTVPKPSYFSKTTSCDFIELGGKISVKDPAGNVIIDKAIYSAETSFIPSSAGNYTLEYSVVDPNENVEKTHTLTIGVLEAGGSTLVLNGVERNYLLYDKMDAGYTLTSNIQKDLPEVFVTVYKDGAVLSPKAICSADFTYSFEQEGEYVFEYETTDYLGQTTIQSFSCTASKIAVKQNDGIEYSVLYGDFNNIVLPTANDFILMDATNGTKINPTKVDIKVRFGDEAWATLTPNVFSAEGVYEILYEYYCGEQVLSVERRIAIYETLPTIQIEKAPQNTMLLQGDSLENDTVRVKALTGKNVGFPYGYFKSSGNVRVEKIIDGMVEDITTQFKSGTYTIKFNEEGEYCISAVITLTDKYIIRKNIFIEVKNAWIEMETPDITTVGVGEAVALKAPKVKDFYGNEIVDGTYKVMYNDTEIAMENGKFVPQFIGYYTIIYTVSNQGESASCEFIYYAIDTVAPVIVAKDKQTEGRQGKNISLANVQLTDNSVSDLGYEIFVTYGGQYVSIYNNQFFAEKEGIYTVTIQAIDASGNASTISYDIEILPRKNNVAWIVIGCVGGALVLAAAGVSTVILMKNKKKEGDSNEQEIG